MSSAASMKPDREGFLRRFENSGEEEEKKKEQSLEEVLQQSGIASSTIDASSLQALRELCNTNQDEKQPEEVKEDTFVNRSSVVVVKDDAPPPAQAATRSNSNTPPPLPEIATNNRRLLRHQPSDLTRTNNGVAEGSDASIAGEEEEGVVTNKTILNQLKQQTLLLKDLKYQMEFLQEQVFHLQKQQRAATNNNAINRGVPVDSQPRAGTVIRGVRAEDLRPVIEDQQPRAGAVIRGVREEDLRPVIPDQQHGGGGGGVVMRVREDELQPMPEAARRPQVKSPLRRIIHLIWLFCHVAHLRVQWEGAMLFKFIFMFMVFANSIGTHLPWGGHKNLIGSILVVVLYFHHCRFHRFCRQFFIKCNMASRIWNGEEINDVEDYLGVLLRVAREEEARAAQQQQQQEGGNRNVHGGGWRDTFFAGVIPDPNQNNGNDGEENNRPNPNFAVRLVQDIVYLLGSFVLSILPMWKPEGENRPLVFEQQDDDDEGNNGDNDAAQPDQRDAMQPLEESDEEEDSIYGEDGVNGEG